MSFDNPVICENLGRCYLNWFCGGSYRKFLELMDISREQNVLEFGSGSGGITKWLEKKCDSLTCLEPSKYYSDLARKRFADKPHVKIVNSRIEGAGFYSGEFDTTVICCVLHDIPAAEQSNTLHQIASCMKEDSILHIVEPIKDRHGMKPDEIESLMNNAMFRLLDKKMLGSRYYGRFQLKRLCESRYGL